MSIIESEQERILSLRGFNPRASNDNANPDVRYGYMRGTLSTVIEDLQWVTKQREIAKISVEAATKLLIVERTLEAVDNFNRAMVHYNVIASRLESALRACEASMDKCILGEAEQQRRSDAYRASIVDGSKRFVRAN